MSRPRFGRYTEKEIEALLEGYAELLYKKHRLAVLVRLADIDRALRILNRREREALVLTEIVGHTNEAAGRLLGISEAAVRKRARRAVEAIYDFVNGDEA